ncbi:hypothetical protein MTP99_004072 [Tenebrio molitor]|nr:hypothetical protein MTP99_004072 [Tenebrio molitor]
MDVCVCLVGADGRVVEGRINTLSATTARSARVRVSSGKGAHGCISVVYVCECEVEWPWVAGESAPERIGKMELEKGKIADRKGCIYMEYCFLEKIRDVNVLIEQLGEFEKFCPKEEIVATDETVEYYSKAIIIYWFFGNVMNCIALLVERSQCKLQRKSDLYRERDPCGLMARCFYPFDVSRKLFPLAYSIQVYTCGIITYYVVVLSMTLVGLMMHVLTQLRYCRKLIRRLDKVIKEEPEDIEKSVR